MSERRTVRQLLGALLLATTVFVIGLGTIGSLAVLSSTRAVNYLSDELAPAAAANSRVLQDLLVIQTSVRAHAISGDKSALVEYRGARALLPRDETSLVSYSQRYPALQAPVARQHRQAQAWLKMYAAPRLVTRVGTPNDDPTLYARGVRLFDSVRTSNAAISGELATSSKRSQVKSRHRLTEAITVIVAVTLLGGLILLIGGWWVVGQIRRPLKSLEVVLARQSAGDLDARVVPIGPREIRQVSEAMNELAEERRNGRDVEAAVQRQLREMDTAKSDFVSNVSHELRTPLTIISGYLELLEEDLGQEVSLQQGNMLAVTRRNVARLRELIEDLLTLNLAEARDTAVQQVDLGTLVSEVSTDMRFTAVSKKVSITFNRPEQPVVVLADASQIHRAVLNIVSNAVKFSSDGGIVRITLRNRDGMALIAVEDEGIGVPADELTKLGSRFYRASNAVRGEVAGTGLGLRIVQTILANHQGTLDLDSVEGVGTVVRIRLPLGADPRPSTARPGSAGTREESTPSGR